MAKQKKEVASAGLTFGFDLRVGGILRRRQLAPDLVLVLLQSEERSRHSEL
jgi:hypothetical protein